MQFNPLIAALLMGTAAIAGCKQESRPATVQPAVTQAEAAPLSTSSEPGVRLSLPALPVIRNAVFSLVPVFDGGRNATIMAQICGLARDELTQEQVNAFLVQSSIDPAKLPRSGNPLSLLVNGDKADQTTACAAYLATSVLVKPDTSGYLKTVNVAAKVDTKLRGKPAQPATQHQQRVDTAALASVLPTKVALARADADIFALIASQLQKQPGLTLGEYRQQAMQLFARLAPVYLQRVKLQAPQGVRFDMVRLDGGAMVFQGSDGSRFDFDGNNLRLLQNDILWFGEGKLMGQDYLLDVAYFEPAVGKLLAPTRD